MARRPYAYGPWLSPDTTSADTLILDFLVSRIIFIFFFFFKNQTVYPLWCRVEKKIFRYHQGVAEVNIGRAEVLDKIGGV